MFNLFRRKPKFSPGAMDWAEAERWLATRYMTTLSRIGNVWRITVHRPGQLMNIEATGPSILDAANEAKFRVETVERAGM